MFFLFLLFFFKLISSENQYPSVKFTKGGIFGWFSALSLMKNALNNTKLFGFRTNSTEPDLSMIISDIINHLNLHDLNISGKFSDALNPKEEVEPQSYLLSNEKCSERSNNVKQLCNLLGFDLNFEKAGISESNVDILLANIAGFFPTNIFFVVIALVAIIYYIVQIVLSYRCFKPSETTSPSIFSMILFYSADALVFISAILFICSFKGIDNFITTLMSLDTVIPRITYSIASSLSSLTEDGIPNGLRPLFEVVKNILFSTRTFLKGTIDSFLNPTEILLQKMVYNNESSLGVFNLYTEKIYPIANSFYEEAKKYPKLENISKFFFTQNFSSYQEQFQQLYDSELKLSNDLNQLDSLFEYIYSVIHPYEDVVLNMSNVTLGNTNITVGDVINDLKEQSLNSFDLLFELRQNTSRKHPLWIFLAVLFFVFGVIFLLAPIFFGFIFLMRNKFSICIASTISICPLVSTILMFFTCFLLTGIGFALVVLSNQFESRVDGLIDNIINITIPSREIVIPPINVTFHTDGNYKGILNLSKIVIPDPVHNFENFVMFDEDVGIARSLGLEEMVDMKKYGIEIGDFIIRTGQNFTMPNKTVNSLNEVKNILSFFQVFPKTIDGFFNWGVPVLLTTDHLRTQIKNMCPEALDALEPYLKKLDEYSKQMNSQFEIALYQLSTELPTAINKLNYEVPNYIQKVMGDLGNSTKLVMKNVYPIINSIQSGLIIGPYALVRNTVFYDLASTCAFLSASGTLMIFGLVVVVTLMWIRRKGMLPKDGSKCLTCSFCCCKKKVENDIDSLSIEESDVDKNDDNQSDKSRVASQKSESKSSVPNGSTSDAFVIDDSSQKDKSRAASQKGESKNLLPKGSTSDAFVIDDASQKDKSGAISRKDKSRVASQKGGSRVVSQNDESKSSLPNGSTPDAFVIDDASQKGKSRVADQKDESKSPLANEVSDDVNHKEESIDVSPKGKGKVVSPKGKSKPAPQKSKGKAASPRNKSKAQKNKSKAVSPKGKRSAVGQKDKTASPPENESTREDFVIDDNNGEGNE